MKCLEDIAQTTHAVGVSKHARTVSGAKNGAMAFSHAEDAFIGEFNVNAVS